ncbi:chemotaxis protein CheW [Desulfuromonas acetoxidans]|uniref:histidine kinase n=1 Tax=Desulfuromonas acetoxidans (strain DSM 684 / 11070) TaxID=281689 RepID=Q1JVS1_DESA6|nr:chemotaxis protein CheW [Desulfuromonas acetoxidans]EAT14333.1 Hpt protein [Desulfuromonas acetoxidans DSM 684]MBF0646774.1 Hpt domain-containing protein [Desulfuromonas acetoxidans]NVD24457.1 Hpt domain-containing protein [Desulfuromonas acetoxidans]NVE16594.1 Hpt domain-containing protein [Desulfuromonas acetoxidans]
MSDYQDSLLPIFIEETEEGLALIHKLLSAWEDDAIDADILEEARRAAHTIKGTAGLVKRTRSSDTAKCLENFLDHFNDSGLSLSDSDVQQVRQWYEKLQELLDCAKRGAPEPEEQEFGEFTEGADNLIEDQGSDLINDFALPFMMKLHQATEDEQEAVKPVCCRFYLGGRQYFIAVEHVLEISESLPITYLPYGPNYIVGLINQRGNVIPVIDLSALEQRDVVLPKNFFLVIAGQESDQVAFISDTLPNLNLKTAGHEIDVVAFIDEHRVKVS